jgi:preprotein translocase subunit YajC
VSSFGFLIIVVAFVLLWLVVMRPQRRRQVEQQRMIADLRIGDEVLTVGGIYGQVTGLTDDEVTVEIAPRIEVRVARRAIAGVVRDPRLDAMPEVETGSEEVPVEDDRG